MYLQEFSKNDIFKNVLKVYPKFHVRFQNGETIVNSSPINSYSLNKIGEGTHTASINSLNNDSKTVNTFKLDYNSDSLKLWSKYNLNSPVTELDFKINFPLTSSVAVEHYSTTTDELYKPSGNKIRLYSLCNILNKKGVTNKHYYFNSTDYNIQKYNQELTLISIPSIFYGITIQKGDVSLSINYSGSLVSKIEDKKYNGELIVTHGINSGSTAGVVLYDEGFIILTGSWDLGNNLKWSKFRDQSTNDFLSSGSYDINFYGTNLIPTMTMMAHAPKEYFNYSNNPTFLKYNHIRTVESASTYYKEKDNKEIKNIVKYAYDNFSGSLEKETYITKIGIFDEHKNLIAIAKVAKPIRKTINREYTFKLTLDL